MLLTRTLQNTAVSTDDTMNQSAALSSASPLNCVVLRVLVLLKRVQGQLKVCMKCVEGISQTFYA